MLKKSCKIYKRFMFGILIISLGLLLLLGILNFIIDPFNMNQTFNLQLNNDLISFRANDRLHKMIEYKEKLSPNILLGDSRTGAIDVNLVKNITGEEYFNFAYSGGTMYEIIDTFWHVVNIKKIKNVYIGINFNLYNQRIDRSLVPEAIKLINSPIEYYLSPFIAKISFYNIIYKITGKNLVIGKPPVSKAVFWNSQLGKTTYNFYVYYKYPQNLYNKLKEIKKYCDNNNINLIFIIPPTHVDLQNKVIEYNLTNEYLRYKKDLFSIATTIDFDYPNIWTKDKDLFNDPYHYNERIMRNIVNEIWNNNVNIGKNIVQ